MDTSFGVAEKGCAPLASYVFARVCDERHSTHELALEDMISLLSDGYYYTRRDTPPKIMRRTPMIGIGAHGGRGLYILGHCTGMKWEELGDASAPYTHRIEVVWDGVVYGADESEVMAGVGKYNQRSWTSASHADFALVHGRVLGGEVVARVHDAPSLPWADEG